MVLGERWLFSIGNEAEIRPLEEGRKSPVWCGILAPYKLGHIFKNLSTEPSLSNSAPWEFFLFFFVIADFFQNQHYP